MLRDGRNGAPLLILERESFGGRVALRNVPPKSISAPRIERKFSLSLYAMDWADVLRASTGTSESSFEGSMLAFTARSLPLILVESAVVSLSSFAEISPLRG